MKKFSSLPKVLLLSTLILIPFILLCVFFLRDSYSMLVKETDTLLVEIAKREASKSSRIINDKFTLMDTLVREILQDPEIPQQSKLQKLADVAENNLFLRIGYANENGEVTTTDNQHFNISDREYFQESIKGKNWVSHIIDDHAQNSNGKKYGYFLCRL